MSNIKLSANFGLSLMALSIVVAAFIVGYTAIKYKEADYTLSVTGSSKKTVKSDQVIWNLQISRMTKLSDLKNAYKQIDLDRQVVLDFLNANNVVKENIVVQPAAMEQQWDGPQVNDPQEKIYSVRQMITITSADVDGVTKVANTVQPIIEKGVLLSNLGLQYNYTKLSNERVDMLAEAMKDARERAKSIAASDNQEVGKFIEASSGVVQVLAKGSVDVSDYGSLDISAIEKDIMVTIRSTFRLK